ncbi:single-stranded DNA-binding protein [Sinomonas sp.]|jgi:single-strand DNA-binding protein|uniref:single-stranded DNA-binding protein n=1 Tax=Sinomonas sp. TaxID=1914986 RepID=UPI002FE2853F
MSDMITIRGFVATDPRTNTTNGGDIVSNFRLAVTERRYDREASAWIDGHTNWFTVVGFRQLASNMCGSLKKGHRVIVVGKLRLKQWEKDGRIFHSAEVEADSVGHDLSWGSAKFARNPQEGQRQELGGARVAVEGIGVVDLETGEMSGEAGHDDGTSVASTDSGSRDAVDDAGSLSVLGRPEGAQRRDEPALTSDLLSA